MKHLFDRLAGWLAGDKLDRLNTKRELRWLNAADEYQTITGEAYSA